MISVIVPIYNVEEYLVRCLESLKIQTYPDYEVLMIDDGSTDSSGMIAESFADNDKFRYFRQKNQGQGAARNTGIEKAKGKYLAFVDSDDWVSKDYLKTMYDALVSADADVTNCHTEYVWSSGKHAPNPVTNLPEEKTTDILKFLENTSFASWNKLYKKELFDDIRFPVKMKYEDYACIPQVIGRAKSVICIEDTLYYYFQRDNSTIHSSENLRDMLKAQRILESSSLAEKYPQVLQRYFFRNIIGSLVWHLEHLTKPKSNQSGSKG